MLFSTEKTDGIPVVTSDGTLVPCDQADGVEGYLPNPTSQFFRRTFLEDYVFHRFVLEVALVDSDILKAEPGSPVQERREQSISWLSDQPTCEQWALIRKYVKSVELRPDTKSGNCTWNSIRVNFRPSIED